MGLSFIVSDLSTWSCKAPECVADEQIQTEGVIFDYYSTGIE